MSELLPNHNRATLVSLARDILLHAGKRVNAEDHDDSLARAEWEGSDTENNLWKVTLSGGGLYASDWYNVSLRSWTTSDFHRYKYDVKKDEFTYEYPVGTKVAQDQEDTARLMHSWLVHFNTPEAVDYDATGVEQEKQKQFVEMGAHLAVKAVLDTDEGRGIFGQLLYASDSKKLNDLHESFYAISRRPESSFYIGRLATRTELESVLADFRPQELPPSPMSQREES